MKKSLLLYLLLSSNISLFSQPNRWTWIKGDTVVPQSPVYWLKYVADVSNKPGARQYTTQWKDASGNLWVFGGSGFSANGEGYLNDLWKYAVSTGEWTWMGGDANANQKSVYGFQGQPDASNKPGARIRAASWTDSSGNLWMFGGYGYAAGSFGNLSDLWKFDPLAHQWTWIKGDTNSNQASVYGIKGTASAANKPGGRYYTVSLKTNPDVLWLFGGLGSGSTNELWKYTISSGQWAWMSGDSIVNQRGIYGIKNSFSPSNKPGSRSDGVGWTDVFGNLWLFGGNGSSGSNFGSLNDLWKYSPSANQWCWMSGDNTPESPGIYGTQGIADTSNKPGGRLGTVSWSDNAGDMWLLGGYGNGATNLGLLNDLWKYSPATGLWVWMGGDNSALQKGVYGEKGIAANANKPGSRFGAVSWTDTTGRLWLFGGRFNYGIINDLWSYGTSTGQWTWMSGDNTTGYSSITGIKGTAAPANNPAGRAYSVGWTDASGNFWLFGGTYNHPSGTGYLNDLWKFTASSGQWTWMSGDTMANQTGVFGTKGTASPENQPPGRYDAVRWVDASGNLWLFGGSNSSIGGVGNMNDLWKFTPSTGLWTWVSGDKIPDQYGVYGTKGVSGSGNKPGGRLDATGWTDAVGNLWLFGGNGFAATANGWLNDLWKYSPATGQWTWVSGDKETFQPGVYGTRGVSTTANKIGSRYGALGWLDVSGNVWILGGTGTAYANDFGPLNDLWKYTALTNVWTWVSGDSVVFQPSYYGTQGIMSATNKPGSRSHSNTWTDTSGNLWFFGGDGYATNSTGSLNDVWKYSISAGQWTWMGGHTETSQFGSYGLQAIASVTNRIGARTGSVNWKDASGDIWIFGGAGYAASGKGALNDLWKYTLSNATLPLTFINFTARKQDEMVLLGWTTVQESNNCCFIVERSPNGTSYDSIGYISAVANTFLNTSYSFVDKFPLQGTNYYRLKQVDKDKKSLFSGIAKVTMEENAFQFIVRENPVQNILYLNMKLPSTQKFRLHIISVSGNVLISEEYKGKKGNSIFSIPVGRLTSGSYIINIKTDRSTQSTTFMKR